MTESSRAGGAGGPSSLEFLANAQLPLEIKTVAVGADGRASAKSADVIRFAFNFDRQHYEAEGSRNGGAAHLKLIADLGALPFSGEPDGPARRRDAESVMTASDGMNYGRLFCDQRQKVWLTAAIEVEEPLTPVSIIAATVEVVAAAKPWVDLAKLYLSPTAQA